MIIRFGEALGEMVAETLRRGYEQRRVLSYLASIATGLALLAYALVLYRLYISDTVLVVGHLQEGRIGILSHDALKLMKGFVWLVVIAGVVQFLPVAWLRVVALVIVLVFAYQNQIDAPVPVVSLSETDLERNWVVLEEGEPYGSGWISHSANREQWQSIRRSASDAVANLRGTIGLR